MYIKIDEFKEALKVIYTYVDCIHQDKDVKKHKKNINKVIKKIEQGECHKVFKNMDR